jgi:hypothetical protein
MSYRKFTTEKAQQELGLTFVQEVLWAEVEAKPVPQWLIEVLGKGAGANRRGEKARAEFIIAPVLLAVRDMLGPDYYLYSGEKIDVDSKRGLNGECDFLLAHTRPSPVLQAPIISLVEAKKQNLETGWGQCVAQMYGARIFNQKQGKEFDTIFGCVTTGGEWQVLRLDGNTVIFDEIIYYLSDLGKVLGVFRKIADSYHFEEETA